MSPGADCFGTVRSTRFDRHRFTRSGRITSTPSTALVFVPSPTLLPSVYEVRRQSISSGCATVRLPAASYSNAWFTLPLVIAHGPKVVKPGWFVSSRSVASTLATTSFDPPSIRYDWPAVITGGLSFRLWTLITTFSGALRRNPSYTETATV